MLVIAGWAIVGVVMGHIAAHGLVYPDKHRRLAADRVDDSG